MKDIVKRQNKVGKKEITHLAEQGSGLCGSRLQLPRVWTALILLVPPELRKVGLVWENKAGDSSKRLANESMVTCQSLTGGGPKIEVVITRR